MTHPKAVDIPFRKVNVKIVFYPFKYEKCEHNVILCRMLLMVSNGTANFLEYFK